MYEKPFNSPICWGKRYEDGDKECMECEFKNTCRPVVIAKASSSYMPNINPIGGDMSFNTPNFGNNQWPRQAPPNAMPQAPPQPQMVWGPQPQYSGPPVQVQQYPQQANFTQQYQQQPMQPMQPQQTQQYYNTFPGESVGERLMKNALLVAFESICMEVARFCRVYPWPPGIKK